MQLQGGICAASHLRLAFLELALLDQAAVAAPAHRLGHILLGRSPLVALGVLGHKVTHFPTLCRPNCTTWLVAGEVFPTDVRAFFHGISAAFGKAGAAAASAIFTQISDRDTFYASAIAGGWAWGS